MAEREPDLAFPACCAHCPHLQPVTGACTHELRQSLLREVGTDRTCSVYSRAKTRAMRDLSESL